MNNNNSRKDKILQLAKLMLKNEKHPIILYKLKLLAKLKKNAEIKENDSFKLNDTVWFGSFRIVPSKKFLLTRFIKSLDCFKTKMGKFFKKKFPIIETLEHLYYNKPLPIATKYRNVSIFIGLILGAIIKILKIIITWFF